MLALSVLYVTASDVAFVAALFFGLKPAVLPVVLEAVVRLKRRAAGGALGTAIAAAAFVAIFAFGVPFPIIVAGAALVGFLAHRDVSRRFRRSSVARVTAEVLGSTRMAFVWLAIWLVPVAALFLALGADHVFDSSGAVLQPRGSVVTFGGAYAVLAYVAQQAVDVFDVAVTERNARRPRVGRDDAGPAHHGGAVRRVSGCVPESREAWIPIVAGIIGSVITVWVTFAPSFLFIFVGAPWVERITGNQRLAAALSGVTAAVVGVVLNLGIWFAIHTLFTEVSTRSFGPISVPVPDSRAFRSGRSVDRLAGGSGSFQVQARIAVGPCRWRVAWSCCQTEWHCLTPFSFCILHSAFCILQSAIQCQTNPSAGAVY